MGELQKEREQLIKQKESIKPQKQEYIKTNSTKRNIYICMLIISALIEILSIIFIKNAIIMAVFAVIIILSIILILLENKIFI